MEELAAALLRHIDREDEGGVREILVRIGEPDPDKAARAIRLAVSHEDLRTERERWLGALLASARPGLGAQRLEELAGRYRGARNEALDLRTIPSLPQVLGSSDFLARLLLRHPHWTQELRGKVADPPPNEEVEPDWTSIRITKYKGLLRIAARDLAGRDFAESPGELSGLADRCLRAALTRAAKETGAAPPTLFALGKLGGRELNFSSDVDVLFVYEEDPDPSDLERNRGVSRLIQTFKRHLEVASEDGFAYRVDLDLRPEGRPGPLANSLDAALRYYESFGADWERQMLIRLRYLTGPRSVGEVFEKELVPFVYRSLITPSAITRVSEMKERIETEKRASGRDLDADLKSGPGGIRDVEFLVQALQLFYGGRHRELRTGNVLEALSALGELGLLPGDVVDKLRSGYLWLRRAEHSVQMAEERQVQQWPRDPTGQLALARRMGYDDANASQAIDGLVRDWTRTRSEVREQFEALVLDPKPALAAKTARASLGSTLVEVLADSPLRDRLEIAGAPFLERFGQDPLPAQIPEPMLRGLARVVASCPESSRYLSHRPTLLHRLIEFDIGSSASRARELERARPEWTEDLESFLDWLRLKRRDTTLLAACLDLGGVCPFSETSTVLSVLAEACLRWTLAEAIALSESEEAHHISVLGMGKVAGRELTYHSDLDLIFLYPDEVSDVMGPSRTAQKLISYLTAITGAGLGYAVDARLRPSGRQGTLVSPYGAFQRYQRDNAATWEHLALMRARTLAGDIPRAQAALHAVRTQITGRGASVWTEVSGMRRRVEQERADEVEGRINFKAGPGGLMDVDFLAAGGLLELGRLENVENLPATPDMLRATATGPQLEELLEGYRFLRLIEARARWLANRSTDSVQPGTKDFEILADMTEPGLNAEDFLARIQDARRAVRSAYDAVTQQETIAALGA